MPHHPPYTHSSVLTLVEIVVKVVVCEGVGQALIDRLTQLEECGRFRGNAEVHTRGEFFDCIVARFVRQRGTNPARVKSVVLVKVLEVGQLVSPAYEDGITEEKTAARWHPRPLSGNC